MPSESSSPDDVCNCGHTRRRHVGDPGAQCMACPGNDERTWRHPFTLPPEPKAPSPNDVCVCGHSHANHTSTRCTTCDRESIKGYMHAFRLPEAEPPEAPIVDVELPEPEAPDPNDVCQCGHKRKQHIANGCTKCIDKDRDTWEHRFELDTGKGWPCGDCGATVPGDLDWCQACSSRCAAPTGCDREDCKHGCAWAADELTRMGQDMEAPRPPRMLRRPPYAVAYVIEGGHLYEVALPGDARVTAEDGILKISHATGAVLALVQAGPMEVADAADPEE